MTWTHSAPLKLDTNTLAIDLKDFYVEVALGNVPGHGDEFILGLNRNVGSTLEDVWGAGVNMVFPTAGEQWEILSDDADDTFGGNGAQIVLLQYLDTNYDLQLEILVMNGTTPVTTVATNIFRPRVLLVIVSGSTNSNEGAIVSRIAGGAAGDERNYMHPNFGFSFDGRFTVENGTTALQVLCQVNAGRQDGIEFRLKVNIGTISNFGVIQFNNIFENVVNTKLPIPLVFAEQTDLVMGALNSGAGGTADCFAVCQLLVIENEFLT